MDQFIYKCTIVNKLIHYNRLNEGEIMIRELVIEFVDENGNHTYGCHFEGNEITASRLVLVPGEYYVHEYNNIVTVYQVLTVSQEGDTHNIVVRDRDVVTEGPGELSIMQVLNHSNRLRQKAQRAWEDLAERLMMLIPNSLQEFACRQGWLKESGWGEWTLPSFLKTVASASDDSDPHHAITLRGNLQHHGFNLNEYQEFEELQALMSELQTAWKGLFSIQVVREGIFSPIEIRFVSEEISHDLPIEQLQPESR